jgi:hypothetical protein
MRTFELLLWMVSAGWAGFKLVAGRSRRADVAFGAVALAAAVLHLDSSGVLEVANPRLLGGSTKSSA